MREHGTNACYVHGCRREECLRAALDAQALRYRLAAYGRWQPFTDAGPARAHLRMLAAHGIGARRAAELAGVPLSTIAHILYDVGGKPPVQRVRPATEAAILAVRPSPDLLAPGAVISSAGTRRRLQALVAAGWTKALLAERLGVTGPNLGSLMRRDHVTAALARSVRDLCDALWNVPPPEGTPRQKADANAARRRAEQRCWVLFGAWADEDIDDPRAVPVRKWLRDPGRRNRDGAVLAGEARELLGFGLSRRDAAGRLNVSVAALEKALERHPETEETEESEAA